MDRRLNTYYGQRLYDKGEKVWVVDTMGDEDYLNKKPEFLLYEAKVVAIHIYSAGDVMFDVRLINQDASISIKGTQVFDSESAAKQFCISRAISILDKKINDAEDDIRSSQMKVESYNKARVEFYEKLAEA